jgi:uncharacterized protein (TIGR02452 family)
MQRNNPGAPPHKGENCRDPRNAKSKKKHNTKACYHCFRMGGFGRNSGAKIHCTKECTHPDNTHSRWCQHCGKVTNSHNTKTHRSSTQPTHSSGGSAQGGSSARGTDGMTREERKAYNIKVLAESKTAISRGGYTVLGMFVAIVVGSIVRRFRPSSSPQSGHLPTIVSVRNQDCLEAAGQAAKEGKRVCLLDCGSGGHFGGGYKKGASAQEEHICRCSTLPQQCENHQGGIWPLGINCAWVDRVCVFRDSTYGCLKVPFYVDVGIIAAVHKQDGELFTRADELHTRTAIRNFLGAAIANRTQVLVLTALGCGAFKNPPKVVAGIFAEVLREFRGCFEEVIFAILDDHNTGKSHNPEGNLSVFTRVLDGMDLGNEKAVACGGGVHVGSGWPTILKVGTSWSTLEKVGSSWSTLEKVETKPTFQKVEKVEIVSPLNGLHISPESALLTKQASEAFEGMSQSKPNSSNSAGGGAAGPAPSSINTNTDGADYVLPSWLKGDCPDDITEEMARHFFKTSALNNSQKKLFPSKWAAALAEDATRLLSNKKEAEAKKKAEEDRLKAEAEAKKKAEEDRLKAEAEAKKKAEEDRLKAEEEAKAAKRELEALRKEVADLKHAKSQLEAEKASLEQDNDSLQQGLKLMGTQMEDLKAERDDVVAERNTFEAEVVAFTQKFISLTQRVQQLSP